ncbi:MAG: hypothetical protein U7127_23025 [Phormidium sp.]
MFTIDLTLKNTPFPYSVQRKEESDAIALYNQILEAMRSSNPAILELTCEKQTEKKIAILTSAILAVQLSQKSSAASAGRPPGFLMMAGE